MARSKRASAVTMDGGAVQIEGFDDFAKTLGYVNKEFPANLKKSNYNIARAILLRARLRSQRVPNGVAAKAARSLRVSRGANYSAISGGGPKWPYFWGAEFGSKRHKQFESWRGNQWGGWSGGPGWFLHPTIREEAPALLEKYFEEVDELTSLAFPEGSQ